MNLKSVVSASHWIKPSRPKPPAKSPALEHYGEYYHPSLHRTQELPVIPMHEMMFRRED